MNAHRVIVCSGAKGGQGTTTIATAIALTLATHGPTLLVDTTGDALAALGHPDTRRRPAARDRIAEPVAVTANLAVVVVNAERADLATRITELRDTADVVIDAGTTPPPVTEAERVLVVRNCYLALRRAVSGPPADRVALVVEPHRALGVRDATDVLGHQPITTIATIPPSPGRLTPDSSPCECPAHSPAPSPT